MTLAVDDDEKFISKPGVMPTLQVAGVARGDEVFQSVVPPVIVEVIDDEASLSRSSPQPLQRSVAPVAGVGAGADRVVKADPMLRQTSALRKQRVGFPPGVLVSPHGDGYYSKFPCEVH